MNYSFVESWNYMFCKDDDYWVRDEKSKILYMSSRIFKEKGLFTIFFFFFDHELNIMV